MDSVLTATRDPRVDVLRGLALVMIFIDHLPGNKLGFATLHVLGFADAAEIFVLFAGFASMLAYGKVFIRSGVVSCVRRIAARCLRIYATHALLLMATLVIVGAWARFVQEAPDAVAPLLDARWAGLLQGLTLHALPGYLDILPLYLVLLAAFPLIFIGMRRRPRLVLGLSFLIWLGTQVDPAFNLPNWLDPAGWYFDPFSWQFLFTIGAALAVTMSTRGGSLPSSPWLTAVSWAYVGFAFFQVFPWSAWGLPSLTPLDWPPPDKTHLSVWRILDILALVQIVFSTERTRVWANLRWANPFEACGRNSLDIFAVGCLLSLIGRLVFRTYGRELPLQIGVNVIGIAAMLVTAVWLDARARRRRFAAVSWSPPAGRAA